jgi:hypothetical protein
MNDMKPNTCRKALTIVALAALFTAEVQAQPALTLSDANFFIELQKTGRPAPAGGGGVSTFKVKSYADSDRVDLGNDGLFGTVLQSEIYGTCIEKQEYVESNSWYAVFIGLERSPSATSGITSTEEMIISRVLGAEFGADFKKPDNSGFDIGDVQTLQAMLWESGETASNDLADGVSGESVGRDAANSDASTWAVTYASGQLPALTMYSLINVDINAATNGFEVDDNGQDFLTYVRGFRPSSSFGIPVPAPIFLTVLGLLGLYRFSRKRA